MYHLTGLLSISYCFKKYHQLNTCVDLTSSVDQFHYEHLIRIHYSSKCTNSLYFELEYIYYDIREDLCADGLYQMFA